MRSNLRTRLLVCCALLPVACGTEPDAPAPEAPTEVATLEQELLVQCALQLPPQRDDLIIYTPFQAPNTARCSTRNSGTTTVKVANSTTFATRVRIGAFFWWEDFVLDGSGPNATRTFRREFFGIPVNFEILGNGRVGVATF